MKISLKKLNLEIIILYILIKKFIKFCDKFSFLYHKYIINLKDRDSGSVWEYSLENIYTYYQCNKKNKIMKDKPGYLFILVYDFCLYIVHATNDLVIKYFTYPISI